MSGPIRLIATDLDGTLLGPDGRVSPRTRASVLAALDAGMHVVPATGRPHMIALDVIEQLRACPWWIFANGSVTWHAGREETIRGFFLDADVARRLVVDVRRSLPNAGFAIEFPDSVVFEAGFEKVVPQMPIIPPSEDVLDRINGDVQKILVFDLGRELDDLFAQVSAAVAETAVPSYSGLPFIELAASLVTKATALELLAADFGLRADQVAALGDNHNDLPMLQWAGRSYAMGNATDDAKAAADTVIGTNTDDAVADVIDELVAELRDAEGT
ncbi:MAG: Cof-type HAD-IIB family hydrolase [Actinomycetota bacterium]